MDFSTHTHRYNPDIEKVVPKDAVVITDWTPGPHHREPLLALLREHYWTHLADQIEAQTKPPRIPEPVLWGVVEAWTARIPIRRWVHHEEGWWVADTGDRLRWEDLEDPVLIRDGIEDGAS